ncbi:hypothetical protein ACFX15_000310 [Malus domestica]
MVGCQMLMQCRGMASKFLLYPLQNPRLRSHQLIWLGDGGPPDRVIKLLLVLFHSADAIDKHCQRLEYHGAKRTLTSENRIRRTAQWVKSSALEPSKKRFSWRCVATRNGARRVVTWL